MVATVDSIPHTLAVQANALLRSAHPEECDPPPEPPPLPTPEWPFVDDDSITSHELDAAIDDAQIMAAMIQDFDALYFEDVPISTQAELPVHDSSNLFDDIPYAEDEFDTLSMLPFPPHSLFQELVHPTPLEPEVKCLNTLDDIFGDQLTDPTCALSFDNSIDSDEQYPSVMEIIDYP